MKMTIISVVPTDMEVSAGKFLNLSKAVYDQAD